MEHILRNLRLSDSRQAEQDASRRPATPSTEARTDFNKLPNEIRSVIFEHYLNFPRVIHACTQVTTSVGHTVDGKEDDGLAINLKLATPSREQFHELGSNTLDLFKDICAKHKMSVDEYLIEGPTSNIVYVTNLEVTIKSLVKPVTMPRFCRIHNLALDVDVLQHLLPYEMMTPHFAGKLNWSGPVRAFFGLFPNIRRIYLVVDGPVIDKSMMEKFVLGNNEEENCNSEKSDITEDVQRERILIRSKLYVATRLKDCDIFWSTYYHRGIDIEVARFARAGVLNE